MNEQRLVELAKKNNRDAMSLLLESNYAFVFGYVLKLCYDQELANDITQDVMLKAIKNIKKFKGNSKFSTWLVRIATNHYLNATKRSKKIVYTDDYSFFDSFHSPDKDIDVQVYEKELFIQVMTHLKSFKNDQRMPFILKHYYGYSYEEISKIMKCPIGTVRSRIHNTIKKLQDLMKGGHHGL